MYNHTMKFLEKFNSESKTYVLGMIITIISLFVVTAVVFLALVSNELDIVMTQPAGDTYTYFMAVMDRILAISLFVVIPLTVYLLKSKNKSRLDKIISLFSGIILLALIITFFGNQYFYMKKYQNGDLSHSKMFCQPTVETKIFDQIIIWKNGVPPTMCVPPEPHMAISNSPMNERPPMGPPPSHKMHSPNREF